MTFRVYTTRFGSLELVSIVRAKSRDEAISAAIEKKGLGYHARYAMVAKKQAVKAGAK